MHGFQRAAHALHVQEHFFKKGVLVWQRGVSFVLALQPTSPCCCWGEVCVLQLESQTVTLSQTPPAEVPAMSRCQDSLQAPLVRDTIFRIQSGLKLISSSLTLPYIQKPCMKQVVKSVNATHS